ncbi:MAG: hypothetical protein ACFBSE_19460 [Prochloraceae cyanobacterium]
MPYFKILLYRYSGEEDLLIEIVPVPGNHYTFILEPHVKVLAERLATHLK